METLTPQPCILIAEDEPRIVSFLQRGLQRCGYQTVIANQGDRALDLVLGHRFDLVLLDLGLPNKDGWAVLNEMRAAHTTIPVIVVTAQDSIGDHLNQYSNTVLGYIRKPFRLSTLIDMIHTCIRPVQESDRMR